MFDHFSTLWMNGLSCKQKDYIEWLILITKSILWPLLQTFYKFHGAIPHKLFGVPYHLLYKFLTLAIDHLLLMVMLFLLYWSYAAILKYIWLWLFLSTFYFLNFVNLQTLRDKNYRLYQAEKVYSIYLSSCIHFDIQIHQLDFCVIEEVLV